MVLFSRLPGGLARISMAAFVLFTAGCYRADNSPQQLVEQFVISVNESNQQALDTLLAWDEVAINQYYVGRDYFNRLTQQKQQEVIDSYRELFYRDYLPAASAASYTIDKVYRARDISTSIVVFESPSQLSTKGEETARTQFTLKMNLYPDIGKWYIIDLNEFVQLNVLKGDYNPDNFYLSEPIP
jgi:hypothetical protein